MRKIFTFILTAALVFSLFAGCTQRPAPEDSGRLSVVTTLFAPYDFVRAVTGDLADIAMLLPPGSESHSYEPSPKELLNLQNSDVFVCGGGESDAWVDKILSAMDTTQLRIVRMMDSVETVEEALLEGMEPEEEEEGAYDEHVWTSPKNAKKIVRAIAAAICAADPENADIYEKNTTAYLAELDDLDAAFQAVVDGGSRKTLVFGDRFPFRYFADAYGLRCAAAFPGCAAETEASANSIRILVQRIQTEQIPVVLYIELSNARIAQTIADATGAQPRLFHACHNISKADFDGGATYLSLMRGNVEVLREALA